MKINLSKPVKVYRKLAGKGYRKGRILYSIMQDGRVRAVRKRVILSNVVFKVSDAGRQRVLRTKQKVVHAFAIGYLVSDEFTPKGKICGACGIDENGRDLGVKIKYNPYKYGHFYIDYGAEPAVKGAGCVLFNERGVTAAYTF